MGIGVGFLADRRRVSEMLVVGFMVMVLGALAFAVRWPAVGELVFLISTVSLAIGVYAVRVLYFAAMEEGRIPMSLTGTAVGLISVVGFTPDIFTGPMTGYILDHYDGVTGFVYIYRILATVALIGLVVSTWFYVYIRRK